MEGIFNEKLELTVKKTYLRSLAIKRNNTIFSYQMKATLLLFLCLIFQYKKKKEKLVNCFFCYGAKNTSKKCGENLRGSIGG